MDSRETARVFTADDEADSIRRLGSVAAVDAALRDVDSQIQDLYSRRSSLRSVRNSFAPIFNLPAEIFARIFHLSISAPLTSLAAALQLIRITHVCWYWRHIALEDRGLWTHPDFTHAQIGYLMLGRAGDLPISLSFPDCMERSWRQVAKLDLLMAKKWQIRSLDITAPNYSIQHEFQPLLSGSAPSLESLRLASLDGICCLQQGEVPTWAPKLRELRLSGCILPYRLEAFSTLTALSIRSIYGGPDHALRLTVLLSMLGQLPNLIDLEIQQACAGTRGGPHNLLALPERTVGLESLKRLVFHDNSDLCPPGAFLKSIYAPRLERAQIITECQHLDSLRLAGEWSRDWISCSPRRSIDSLTLCWDENKFQLSYNIARDAAEQEQRPSFQLQLNMPTWSSVVEHYFTQLVSCDVIPVGMMSQLTSLDITAVGLDTIMPGWANNINWREFATLGSLADLSMDDIPCMSFLAFVGAPRGSSAESTLFPALRALTFRDVIMWRGTNGINCHGELTLIGLLTAWLARRAACGKAVDSVLLKACYCLYDPRDEIESVVRDFVMEPPFMHF